MNEDRFNTCRKIAAECFNSFMAKLMQSQSTYDLTNGEIELIKNEAIAFLKSIEFFEAEKEEK